MMLNSDNNSDVDCIPHSAFTASLHSSITRFLAMGTTIGVLNLPATSGRTGSVAVARASMNVKNAHVIHTARNLLLNAELHGNSNAQSDLIDLICDMKTNRRIYKMQPAMAILALMLDPILVIDVNIRRKVSTAVPVVVSSLSDIYMFLSILKEAGRKSGTLFCKSIQAAIIANGERSHDVDSYIAGLIKFKNRNGWQYRDALRLSHTDLKGISHIRRLRGTHMHSVVSFALGMMGDDDALVPSLKRLSPTFRDYLEVKHETSVERVVERIGHGLLDHTLVPNEMLNRREVWQAFMKCESGPTLSAIATLRNLANMTRTGAFEDPETVDAVIGVFSDTSKMRNIHFMQLFLASYAYSRNPMIRPNERIMTSIESAMTSAYERNREKLSRRGYSPRVMHNLDMSASMFWETSRVGATASNPFAGDVAAAMMFLTCRSEDPSNYDILGFGTAVARKQVEGLGVNTSNTTSNGLIDIKSYIQKSGVSSLQEAITLLKGVGGGGTNMGASIQQAIDTNSYYDAFVYWTDSDLNSGVHPSIMLERYRDLINPNAKLITVCLSTSDRSVVNPNDVGMMDIVGFDAETPNIIQNFIEGVI